MALPPDTVEVRSRPGCSTTVFFDFPLAIPSPPEYSHPCLVRWSSVIGRHRGLRRDFSFLPGGSLFSSGKRHGDATAVDWSSLAVVAVIFLATLIRSAFGFGEALVAVP